MSATVLPAELQQFAGRITDTDAHEMIPAQEWVNVFGKETQALVDFFVEDVNQSEKENKNTMNIPDYQGDILPVAADVLSIKGARAPSAMSPERRIEVMDAMGIGHQLFFPTGLALMGVSLYKSADDPNFMRRITGDRRAIAKNWFHLYNEWLRTIVTVSDRLRPAALLYGDTPAEVIALAEQHIKAGFKAVMYLPSRQVPGGRSPAHPDLDPLWARLAEANCAFTLHVESDGNRTSQDPWRNAPAFEGFQEMGEFSNDPAFMASVHLPFENFLAIMVLGGVFDRHPSLRMGVLEIGAHWIGPLIQRLDMWYRVTRRSATATEAMTTYRLPNPPSYYIKKNVRVTPYVFEDVARYLSTYDLDGVLTFSSDYPHVEGGKNPFGTFYKNLQGIGAAGLEDFFVNNGRLLLPD